MIDTFGQVVLGFLAELEIFHRDLAHKFEIFLEFFTIRQVIVVEFHSRNVRISRGTDPERGHASPVYVQRAVGEEV